MILWVLKDPMGVEGIPDDTAAKEKTSTLIVKLIYKKQ